MIKIEGENGIVLTTVLKIIQERCSLTNKKEALARTINALQRDSVILTVCEIIDEQLEIEQSENADAHTCRFNARGECEICGAIKYNSPLHRELYGGE